MKKLILFAFFACAAFGQCSFPSSTFPIQMPGETAVSVTMQTEAVCSTIVAIEGTPAPGTVAATLTSGVTSSATSIPVSNIIGVQTCMGILTGSELSLITAITPGTAPAGTLTVVRARVGTTAAAYNSGQAASYTQWGDGGCFLAMALQQGVQAFMSPGAFPGPTVTTAKAAIATQQTTINTTISGGVTHVP